MPMAGDFGGSRKASNSGFWGSISESVSQGAQTLFTQVVPVWAAKELRVQQNDQLSDPLFNQNTAPPRINDGLITTGGSVQSGQPVRTGLLFDNINVSGAAILGLAIAVVAVVVVSRS